MASKRDQERVATRAVKRSGGTPELSRYASKGGPHRYDDARSFASKSISGGSDARFRFKPESR